MAERAARAFHVILTNLEPVGINFSKSQGRYNPGFFRHGQDRLYFYLDETLTDKLGSERRVHYWQWSEGGSPSGRLSFLFKTSRYGQGEERHWTETSKMRLEKLLSQIITGIRNHFLDCNKRRKEEEIKRKQAFEEWQRRNREWEAKEEIRLQNERQQKHENSINSTIHIRKLDLIKAAEWWRIHKNVTDFIDECDRRWKSSSGELNPEQVAWLTWAKEIADKLSLFTQVIPTHSALRNPDQLVEFEQSDQHEHPQSLSGAIRPAILHHHEPGGWR
jgi:hypothetical protein